MNNITVNILDVYGLNVVGRYVGLPVNQVLLETRPDPNHIPANKLNTLTKLISAGDEHAKIMRQVNAHLEITAPRYWWQQFSCYRAGVEMYSGSTMHTLLRDGVGPYSFTPETKYGSSLMDALEDQDLTRAKANLPEGYLQTRLILVSYQTLRRIVFQRRGHKLPEWAEFIRATWELPYADELIFVESRNPWRKLWEWVLADVHLPWIKYQYLMICAFCGYTKPHHEATCPYTKARSMMIKEITDVVTE